MNQSLPAKLPVSVLLVEDDDDIRSELYQILSRQVETVVAAHNGANGLEKYFSTSPDIIITDIKMPIMDGLTMAKKIRNNDSNVQMIFMSAFNNKENVEAIMKIGVTSFVLKPVTYESFCTALKQSAELVVMERETQ